MDEDHGQVARDNAITFEAVKTSMSQTKDGVILRLAVHPNDCPPSLHTDWVGTRYSVAMVAINDDDTPKIDLDKQHVDRLIQSAGMLCRNISFLEFMRVSSEAECIDALRDLMGVKSRSEMRTNEKARAIFEALRQEFTDVKGGI